MNTDPDIRTETRDCGTEPHTDDADAELRSLVVEYENRPDRRTLFPADLSGVERMPTWLTADADVFVNPRAKR